MRPGQRRIAVVAGALALSGTALAGLPAAVVASDNSEDLVSATGIYVHPAGSNHFTFVSSGSGSQPCTVRSDADPVVRCTVVGHGTTSAAGTTTTFRVISSDGTVAITFAAHACEAIGTEHEAGQGTSPVEATRMMSPVNPSASVQTVSVGLDVYDTPSLLGC